MKVILDAHSPLMLCELWNRVTMFLEVFTTMKKGLLCSAVAIVSIGMMPYLVVGAPSGKEVFTKMQCTQCHAVKSDGIDSEKPPKMKAPDLSGVGAKQDAAWFKKFLNKETELNGKKHFKKFSGTAEEGKALYDWLASLKK
jgi:hypothetical protein